MFWSRCIFPRYLSAYRASYRRDRGQTEIGRDDAERHYVPTALRTGGIEDRRRPQDAACPLSLLGATAGGDECRRRRASLFQRP